MYKEAVIKAPGQTIFVEKELKKLQKDEALIKIHSLGLCGSDLHLNSGSYKGPHKYPIVPGHEWSGEIIDIGKDVKGFKKGERVAGDASFWCGECKYCHEDKNICVDIDKRGLTKDGAASEYIVTKSKYLYKIPDNVDYELACMAEPFAVAAHAIHKGMGDKPSNYANKKVLILGGGPIGMAVVMLLCKRYGFKDVYISDLVEYRIKLAEKFGAKKFEAQKVDNTKLISYNEMYDNEGYDFVFESTGVNVVLDNAFSYVKPLGTIVALAPIREIKLNGGLIVLKSVKLIGSIGGTGEFDEVLKAFSLDTQYYKQMISHKFKFDELEKALEVQKNELERLKVIIEITN